MCRQPGDTILSVIYSDQAPWPVSTDGGGFSLVTKDVNPAGDLNDPSNWRASYAIHGSPGKDDLPSSSVETSSLAFTGDFTLYQNYPNPFNPVTTIPFEVGEKTRVTLKLFDLLGREIMTLADAQFEPGHHTIQFKAGSLSSGMYIYQIKMGNAVATRKMVILK
ncbi:T9SS type A sorting domain-containing protein [bacterium]|nr:T9SS type A sorting domain-containing protein [bacterium]